MRFDFLVSCLIYEQRRSFSTMYLFKFKNGLDQQFSDVIDED